MCLERLFVIARIWTQVAKPIFLIFVNRFFVSNQIRARIAFIRIENNLDLISALLKVGLF